VSTGPKRKETAMTTANGATAKHADEAVRLAGVATKAAD
jgi:hypothetical protein